MSYDYSESLLVQERVGHPLEEKNDRCPRFHSPAPGKIILDIGRYSMYNM